MPEESRVDSLVDVPAVKSELDKLFDMLQNVLKKIQEINQTGAKINLSKGLSESTIAAQQAKAATEDLKRAKAELAVQEAQVKLTMLQTLAAHKQLEDQARATINQQIGQQQIAKAAAEAALAQSRAQVAAQKAANAAAAQAAKNQQNAAGSVNALKKELNDARKAYYALSEADREAAKGGALLKRIQELHKEVSSLEQAAGQFQRNVGNYPNPGKAVIGGIAGFIGVTSVAAALEGIATNNFKASDQLGDLTRNMGLTTKEADKLLNSLKALDTRTTTEGLLDIANVAAKAGVAKGDIAGVTEAVDKLLVVLGGELGDATQATEGLVKIVTIFSKDGKVTGDSLTKIGNAILELGNAGTASGPFLLDFTQRLAGIAKTANLSLPASLGLAAAFEQLGGSAQDSSSAITELIIKVGQDLPKFAQIAGKSLEEFTKTFRDSPQEALLQVSEGFIRARSGADEVAKAFKVADVNAVGLVKALGLMGNKADVFRNSIDLARRSLEDTTNITEQFEIKNNTLAGSFERLKNAVIDLTTNPNSGIASLFKALIDGANKSIYAIDQLITKIKVAAGGIDPEDISSETLSRLSRRGNVTTAGGFAGGSFARQFQAAQDDRIAQQQPFIDAFGGKSKEEQVKDIRELREAITAAKRDFKDFSDSQGKTSSAAINTAIGIKALTERLNAYNRIFLGVNKTSQTATTITKELTDAEKKAAETRARNLRERGVKAEADSTRYNLMLEIDAQKAILENSKATFDERMTAADRYYQLKNQLADSDVAAERKRLQEEVKAGKANAKELTALDAKLAYDRSVITSELGKNIGIIIDSNADERTRKIQAAYSRELEFLEESNNKEVALAQNYYAAGLLTKEQYEAQLLKIANKYDVLALEQELKTQEEVLALMKERGLPVEDIETNILAIRNKIRALDLKYFTDSEKAKTKAEEEEEKKRQELRRQEIQMSKQLAKESLNAIFSVFKGQNELQQRAIQQQIEDLDDLTQKQIDAVNKSTDSEQKKAEKISIINARAQSQKEILEQRQRQLNLQAARFERARAIGEIIAQTAINVVKFFSVPVLAVLAAAVGAAQLANVLASPLPAYKDGVESHIGGPMKVNDGGKIEVIEEPSGKTYMYKGYNVITEAPKGTTVHKSIEDYRDRKKAPAAKIVPMTFKSPETLAMTAEMGRFNERMTRDLLAGMAKHATKVHVSNTFTGMKASFERGVSRIERIEREIKG